MGGGRSINRGWCTVNKFSLSGYKFLVNTEPIEGNHDRREAILHKMTSDSFPKLRLSPFRPPPILFWFYIIFVACISRYSLVICFLWGPGLFYRLSIWLFILVLLVCITIDAIKLKKLKIIIKIIKLNI